MLACIVSSTVRFTEQSRGKQMLLRVICLCLVCTTCVWSQGFDQQSLEANPEEQRSIDQLRIVVESIKSCTFPQVPLDAEMESEGFSDVMGPPTNVVWNVELHPSVRSRYIGSIEFSEASYMALPPSDSYCNKPHLDKNACKRAWLIGTQIYRRQRNHPLQFRYEFDVTSHGLEFSQALSKKRQDEYDPWVPDGITADGCAARAIKSLQNAKPVADDRSSEIPDLVWDAAEKGYPKVQYFLGQLYADGKGVPQDYAEAYFWMNLAASREDDVEARAKMAKGRDETASHLTPSVLLQVQQRARAWIAKATSPSSPNVPPQP
jgi:hypothetical protein